MKKKTISSEDFTYQEDNYFPVNFNNEGNGFVIDFHNKFTSAEMGRESEEERERRKAREDLENILERFDQEPVHSMVSNFSSILAIENQEVRYVMQVQLPWSEEHSKLCHCTKNLYNHANWLVRMRYFFKLKPKRLDEVKKIKEKLRKKHTGVSFTSLTSFTQDYKKAKKRYIDHINEPLGRQDYYGVAVNLFYNELWRLVMHGKEFKALDSGTAQQVLKYVVKNWKSYFKATKEWRKHPEKFRARPGIPRYKEKDGEFVAVFKGAQLRKIRAFKHFERSRRVSRGKVTAEILFPVKAGIKPVRFRIDQGRNELSLHDIVEIRIVPRDSYYVAEFVYSKRIEDLRLNKNRMVSVDLGVNNPLTTANNFGDNPRIVKGGVLKSANQLANKLNARYRSELDLRGIEKDDRQLKRLWRRRNAIVKNYMHRVSRWLINYCVSNDVGKTIVGYNEGWKQEVKIGKRNNQNFVGIPFLMLIKMIEYKAKLVGIEVEKITEEYTSQRCCCCGRVRKANRVKRGLYKCNACLREINADVNSATNIMVKAEPEALSGVLIKNLLLSPQKVVI